MSDFSFEDFNFGGGGGGGGDIDFSGFDNLDISSLLDGGGGGIDFGSFDAGPGAFDLSGVEGIDLSSLIGGDSGIDLSALDMGPEAFDIASLLGGDSGIDFGGLDAGPGAFNLSELLNTEGGAEALSRSLGSKRISLADLEKDTTGGTGLSTKGLDKLLTSTGRGQLSLVDAITGAQGITGEGFNSLKDLLGSGTKEEIARYTPGTADYSFRSGLETEGGQGFNADATRGMGLSGNGKTDMGGAQGLSKYIPAQFSESALNDLVKNNPGKFPEIENYLDSQYDLKGLTPFRGSGGTLSETGFLANSSAANPLGAKYAIGNIDSIINKPSVTGQQAAVSPGKTIISNGDGTYRVVTTGKDGTNTKTVDTKTLNDTKTLATILGLPADNSMLMMLMALLALMSQNKGTPASNAVIPSLSADRQQLPYGPASGAKPTRPGAGGVTYFSPTTYTQKAAGGGMMGGGISDLGGYSDGGRLLKGPGDGVSDSIPATIGGKQPARLAEGEFVVPARIVSELGNGSTNAGAQKLYAMMDRVQNARRKTKNVAADTKAHKYLPV